MEYGEGQHEWKILLDGDAMGDTRKIIRWTVETLQIFMNANKCLNRFWIWDNDLIEIMRRRKKCKEMMKEEWDNE